YGRPPPSYASGVAYPDLHLVLLTLVAPGPVADAPDLTEVFVHELSHVALFDAVQGAHVPRWFNEGIAIYVSGEHPFARTQTLSNASFSKSLLPMTGLDAKFPANHYEVGVAYAQSADFVRFLLRDADKARFQSLIARVRAGTMFDRAIEDAYGTDFRKLEYQWKEDVAKRYAFLPSLAGGSFLWALVIVAMFVGYMKRRKRNKVFYQKWENEEAREAEAKRMQLAAENSLAEELRNNTMRPKQELPKVEHDGHWHTLH
ncbi:MAG: hypothetical protein KBF88_06035, partial [Polyangiaceae bacterium]|nr:hypothetical protein [Polyangiaceae bacterium]